MTTSLEKFKALTSTERQAYISEHRAKCPTCNAEDEYCTLCDGDGIVTLSQHNEFRRQNPGAL